MNFASGVAFLLLFLPITVKSTCYFPNGEPIQDTPCNSDAVNSTCCGPGYACLSNTVCALTEHVSSEVAKLSPYYVRASCTDSTWSSPECPSFCLNSTNGDNLGVGGMGVGKCDGDGSVDRYYCRNSKTADLSDAVLCKNSSFYFGFSGFPTTVTIIGVDPTSAPPLKVSPTPTPSQSSAPNPPSTCKDYSKVPLGAGLGAGLGVHLLAALAFIAFVTFRRGRSHTTEPGAASSPKSVETNESETPCALSSQWSAQRSSPVIHEVNGDLAIHEIPSRQMEPHELSPKDQ